MVNVLNNEQLRKAQGLWIGMINATMPAMRESITNQLRALLELTEDATQAEITAEIQRHLDKPSTEA
jgi:hypothetical protein